MSPGIFTGSDLKIRLFVPQAKPGIFDKVKQDPNFHPPRLHRDLRQEYGCMSRTGNEDPTNSSLRPLVDGVEGVNHGGRRR
jgi:hypothetical protein